MWDMVIKIHWRRAEERIKPVENIVGESIGSLQPAQQDRVVKTVKCRGKSKNATRTWWPLSIASSASDRIFSRAVSVEWCLRKLDCCGGSRSKSSIWCCNWPVTIRSRIFDRTGTLEIRRKEPGSSTLIVLLENRCHSHIFQWSRKSAIGEGSVEKVE